MIDNIVLVSDVQRSDSVRPEPASILLQIVSHGGHYGMLSGAPGAISRSQSSILKTAVCARQSESPSLSLPSPAGSRKVVEDFS